MGSQAPRIDPKPRKETYATILSVLGSDSLDLSQIVEGVGLSTYYVRLLLTELELSGDIERMPKPRPVRWRVTPHA